MKSKNQRFFGSENQDFLKAKAYVGITGYKTTQEVKDMAEMFRESGFPNIRYEVMFGVLSSYKRIDDVNSEGKKSPCLSKLPEILQEIPSWGLPMIHYYTPRKESLCTEILSLFTHDPLYDANLCRAVQLNVDWPPLEHLNYIIKEFPELKIVLQLPPRATEGLGLEEIAKRAKEYDNLVKYALIDPSRGKGLDFEVQYSVELMSALNQAMPHTRIGIAGGFDADNVKKKVPLIKEKYQEDFFIDAQGRLRTEDRKALDLNKAERYIKACSEVFL
ncbi:hypothetical protein AYK26_04780 [Euryarchaeota archaeon SM23-78]|nr:MAG: hypothetical protein AYK26_04780 [Euryarchaeota archaeon SM23-78]MBW3000755.1 hypothetical protein [Candidatus Woesearchaeota archaeon]